MSAAGRPAAAAPAPVGAMPAQALIGFGQVRHARHRPREHAFTYPTAFLLLPMRSLRARPCPELSRGRRGWWRFDDADHGDGRRDALAWLEALLQSEGIDDADGEIWLQTYPRVAGYAFKPVSFWYCLRADGSPRAIVAEVNNTFGERHCYLLDGPELAWGATVQARKVFHVSPFCAVDGAYRFRFGWSDGRIVARVEHVDDQGPLIVTSVSGSLQPLDAHSRRRARRSMPLLSWGVIARIHWQALALWRKRLPFFRKPPLPDRLVTR